MKTKQLDNLKEGDAVVFIKEYKGLYGDAATINVGHKMYFNSLHKIEPMSASTIYFTIYLPNSGVKKMIAFSPMNLSKYIQPLVEKRNEILEKILK